MIVETLDDQTIPRARPDNKFFRTVVGPEVTNLASPTILEVNSDGNVEVLLMDGILAQVNLRL